MHRHSIVIVCICTWLLVPLGVSALATTTLSSADSWLNQESANRSKNYGNDTFLDVRSDDGNRDRRLLVAFSVPVLPTGPVITRATLSLFLHDAPPQDRTWNIYAVPTVWSEGEVNWNDQPTITDMTVISGTHTGIQNDVALSWDVASEVSRIYSGGVYYGWEIRDSEEGTTTAQLGKVYSREYSDASKVPMLSIEYSVPPKGSIAGSVWADTNADGIHDISELLQSGFTVIASTTGQRFSTTTDVSGGYSFTDLSDGVYDVCVEAPLVTSTWSQSFPIGNIVCADRAGYEINIVDGTVVSNNDFGYIPYGSLSVSASTSPQSTDGFQFVLDNATTSPVVQNGSSYVFKQVTFGTHTVDISTSTDLSRYTVAASCDGAMSTSSISIISDSAVECRFLFTEIPAQLTVSSIHNTGNGPIVGSFGAQNSVVQEPASTTQPEIHEPVHPVVTESTTTKNLLAATKVASSSEIPVSKISQKAPVTQPNIGTVAQATETAAVVQSGFTPRGFTLHQMFSIIKAFIWF